MFGRARNAPTTDVQLLKDALLAVLEEELRHANRRRRERIERLISRLDRLPVPSGLVREVSAVTTTVATVANPGVSDGTREAGAALRHLACAMATSALLDQDLGRLIESFAAEIPLRVNADDASEVSRRARQLQQAARPIREHAERQRTETARLVHDLGFELSRAVRTTAAMGTHLGEIEAALASAESAAQLAKARNALLGQIRELTATNDSLREELQLANQRTDSLRQVATRQAQELVDVRSAAALDPLTDLCHRGTFERALDQGVQQAHEHGRPLSLLIIDLDHFKQINDTHGHSVGDDILRGVSARLATVVRDRDLVARIGGEEFAALLPGAATAAAEAVAERVCRSIARFSVELDHVAVSVTASVGVAQLLNNESPRGLFKRADRALYNAKEAGRNRTHLASV